MPRNKPIFRAGDELTALAEEMEKKESETGEMDYKKEIEERKYFSEKATAIMDGVFGEGTTQKFFGDLVFSLSIFISSISAILSSFQKRGIS